MSDTILKIIPTNPSYVPSEESQSKAQKLLEELYEPEIVEFLTTDEIEFVGRDISIYFP